MNLILWIVFYLGMGCALWPFMTMLVWMTTRDEHHLSFYAFAGSGTWIHLAVIGLWPVWLVAVAVRFWRARGRRRERNR